VDFTLSPEQEALRDSVFRFAEREHGWEQRAQILRARDGRAPAHWRTFAELGWLGAGLSEEAGGFGGGAAENAIVMEALAPALVVEPLIPHIIASRLLSRSTSPAAVELLAAMVMGERRAVLVQGEESGLTFGEEGGDARLGGRVALVPGGADADLFIVAARVAGDDCAPRLCLVDAQAAGVEIQPYRLVDNHRAAQVSFDLDVSPDRMLAFPAGSADALDEALDHGIVALCAEAVGVMEASLWLTRDYLVTRKQFGTTLSAFQALQHRMADMLIETEMARSILFQAIASVEDENPDVRRRGVSAAKALVSTAGLAVGAGAIQLHGAIGMTEEYVAGHYYKRLFAIARLLGSSDDHLARFAAATERLIGQESGAA
jgi:alkylation response protein AidB-like acyl-CoA dehydrogenase